MPRMNLYLSKQTDSLLARLAKQAKLERGQVIAAALEAFAAARKR